MEKSESDWKRQIQFEPDPYIASGDLWRGSLPPSVNWTVLEDRLLARGWFPKNAAPRLRVYGFGKHEIVIEPASRQVVFRLVCEAGADHAERERVAAQLASTLAREALAHAT